MSKFNRPIDPEQAREINRGVMTGRATSPVQTAQTPTGKTYEGAPGFERDPKSELFLLGINNLVGEATFYEDRGVRDARFRSLVHANAIDDPLWTFEFLRWLRTSANMRSAPLVGAVEFVRARLGLDELAGFGKGTSVRVSGDPREINRAVIDAVCQRPDEPGELLAYWTSRYGRALPKPIKRGLADAVARLYTERNLIKYDGGDGKGFRFGDVIELVHPSTDASKPYQGALFRHAIDRRHGHQSTDEVMAHLRTIRENNRIRSELASATEEQIPQVLRDPNIVVDAALTWESVLSLVGSKVDKAVLWDRLIPYMGLMALVRNLRNFDQAGVSDASIDEVNRRLSDPEEIAGSRMFPYRFYSAHRAAQGSLNWGRGLSRALDLSCRNLPVFDGRTLVLVDTSGSMTQTVSEKSQVTLVQAGALFGVALAHRNIGNVDLYGWADDQFRHEIPQGHSVLSILDSFTRKVSSVGDGTQLARAMRSTYDGHDRVVVFTDMQTFADRGQLDGHAVSRSVPENIPVYAFNLAGYRYGAMATGGKGFGRYRHEFGGGFSDATFQAIPLLEAGQQTNWPWL